MNRQVKSTILTAALLLTGTTVGAENRSESKNQQAMKAIELTAEAFQKQVFDYTKNSEWKYEGDLPAVRPLQGDGPRDGDFSRRIRGAGAYLQSGRG